MYSREETIARTVNDVVFLRIYHIIDGPSCICENTVSEL